MKSVPRFLATCSFEGVIGCRSRPIWIVALWDGMGLLSASEGTEEFFGNILRE